MANATKTQPSPKRGRAAQSRLNPNNGPPEDDHVHNPSARSTACSAMLPRIELMRACYGGTETMRQMTTFFLPKAIRETDTRYAERLSSTFALNKLREAVEAASAKPFKNLLTLENADPELEDWMWDADLDGHHLHLVGHRHFNEAVQTGLSHILIDHPSTSNLPNLAVQRSMGIRPYMRQIKAEDLLACYYERIGGEKQVAHARLSSTRISYDPATYRELKYDQVFVIERGVVQLWERPTPMVLDGLAGNAIGPGGSILTSWPIVRRYLPVSPGGAWKLVGEERINLPKVPLVSMVAGDEESELNVRPIFMDLAYKQIEHWQSSSEQRSILTAGRFPMLAASGITVTDDGPEGQGFEIGPWKILTSPDAQGRWYYVEPSGKAIEVGQKDIDKLEEQMDMMSLNPVTSQPGRQYVSQNERSIMEARTNTVVHDLAHSCKDSLEEAIQYMGLWTGKDYSKVRINMNFDFSGTDEKAKSITSILQAVTSKALSREGALHELKRLQLLNDNFDIDAELKRPVEEPVPETPLDKSMRDFPGGQTRPTAQN